MRSRFSTLHLESTTALWSPGMARTGFIEGAILLALTSAGVSGAALGFLTTGLTTLVTTGLSIGASMLANSLFAQKPPTPKAQDVQANIRQSLASRRRHHGKVHVGSVVVFGFRRNERLFILHYIGEGPIQGYEQFFLDRRPAPIDEDGWVRNDQYDDGGDSAVRLLTTLGTMTDEPFTELIDVFPELDRPLKPFRARGCTMVLQIVKEVDQEDLTDVYPNNLPSLEVTLEGLLHFDPRTGDQVYSTNAGICLLSEVMNVYGLTEENSDEIDFQSFADFADHCDEAVPLKAGGTEPRYRCAGTIFMDAENEKRIQAITAICNADVFINSEGKIAVRKRLSVTPLIELKAIDGDHLSISLESGRRDQKKFNSVKVVYKEEQRNWKEVEAYYRNAEAQEEDGQELIEMHDAALCPSGTQAQRIGKLVFHERNPDLIGSVTSGLQALELISDPVATIDLTPEDNLIFIARSGNLQFDPTSKTVSFDVQSVDENAEAWDPQTEEEEVTEIGPALPSLVGDLTLEVTANVDAQPNSAAVLEFSWIAVDAPGGDEILLPSVYSQQLQVSLADLNEWQDAQVTQSQDTGRFAPVIDGASYDWRIRNVRAGQQFDWQTGGPITVIVDNTAPEGLLTFTALGGDNIISVGFGTENDPHLNRVLIYVTPVGVTLDRDIHLATEPAVAPGVSYSIPVTAVPGSWDAYAEPANISGLAGPLSGPITVTVT